MLIQQNFKIIKTLHIAWTITNLYYFVWWKSHQLYFLLIRIMKASNKKTFTKNSFRSNLTPDKNSVYNDCVCRALSNINAKFKTFIKTFNL